MLDFEAALARAVAPADAAEAIAAACVADGFDLEEIGRSAADKGTPVPGLLSALRAKLPEDAAAHLHRGATSQDVVDSAAMLVAGRALGPLLEDLGAAADACAGLAERYRDAPMAGRTLLQQAAPITFGLEAAGWLSGLDQVQTELADVRANGLAVQLGGAVGTLAALGDEGPAAVASVARSLGLAEPALPWHANRVRVAELGGALELVAGACAKIAGDVILLAQTEVGEVTVPAGGSTAMAHKRNPASAVVAVAAARQVTPRIDLAGEHERAAGAWQAEWPAIAGALAYAGGTAAATRETLDGLEVNSERMRANISPELAGYPPAGDVFVDRALERYGQA